MNQLLAERRQRHRRKQRQRPYAVLAAMLTGCIVTLIGVFSNVEPLAVLFRATLSSILMGVLVAIGIGVIKTANKET
ncbi:hypothetical protein [Mariniblastus fucicola]|uniref:Uncharacterized protein n=1 Tax=Mariniblastus fucicola TaxID=980251 RepID=A0A5B9PAU2_9BACT|nr:hypothetical protein [Mariniblastus fucicola]QEG23394.1 hypothetical protein MFFC18_32920 [Mariniblastus fucicola]